MVTVTNGDVPTHYDGICSQRFCVLYLFPNLVKLFVSLVVEKNSNSYSRSEVTREELTLIP